MANYELRAGDIVVVHGFAYEIAEVWECDHYKGVWDVEFIDTMNGYHHWKSDEDGGRVIYKEEVA